MDRKYVVFSRQSYSNLNRYRDKDFVDEVLVGPYNDDGIPEFEFGFEFVNLSEVPLGYVCCRLVMFDDAFIALYEYSDLFNKLKKIESLTLEQLESILIECGFEEQLR